MASHRLAKLTAPRLPTVIKRPRLFRQLDQARAKPAVWVMGPPGSGKSTLIADYISFRKLPSIWYQIDEGDSDPATFFHYFSLATKTALPRYRQPLPHFTIEYRNSLKIFTRRFFEALCSRLRKPFVIVFDNYQEIQRESALHEVFEELTGSVPRHLTLVVISRRQPPDVLARATVCQAIHVFDPDSLRLTKAESRELAVLHGKGAVQQSHSAKDWIYTTTSGWMAGVLLLLQHAQMNKSIVDVQWDKTPEVLFDYLAREVLMRMDRSTQRFLLKTSFLPYMTETMVRTLTGSPNAPRLLRRLHETRYFVERRFEAQPIYQYHPLFRHFLITQAKQEFSPENLRQIQLQSATLLEESERTEEAIDLLSEAQALPELIRLLLEAAPTLFSQGRVQTLQGWLMKLPPAILDETPWALFWLGSCLCLSDPRQGQQVLERAIDAFQHNDDSTGKLATCCTIVESIITTWANIRNLDTWIDRLRNFLADSTGYPATLDARVTFALFIGQQWGRPNKAEIDKLAERIERNLEHLDNPALIMLQGFQLMNAKLWFHQWEAAQRILNSLRRISQITDMSPLAEIGLLLAETLYAFVHGDGERCMLGVERGLEIARHHGLESVSRLLLTNGSLGALAAGDLSRAEAYLSEAKKYPEHLGVVDHLSGWLKILKGNVYEARKHLDAALQESLEIKASFLEAFNRVPAALILHEQGYHAEAMQHLSRAKELVKEIQSPPLDWACGLVEARMAFDRGQEQTGLEYLAHAMAIGRDRAIENFLWWRPAVIAQLYGKALEAGIEPEYVRHVIRKRRLRPDASMKHCTAWPWPVAVCAFGPFEVRLHEEPIRFSRKAQQRPLDLLKALIAFGGRNVPETTLTDALWPEADGDAGHQAFATTLHRLRKLIGSDNLELKGGLLSLVEHSCFVDVWAFEQLLEKADDAMHDASCEAAQGFRRKALALYRGAFLKDMPAPWAEAPRDSLRRKFARVVIQLANDSRLSGNGVQSRDLILKGLELDPTAAELHAMQRSIESQLRDTCQEPLS